MVLTHTKKGARQFHYYANRYETIRDAATRRVGARDLETIVIELVTDMLTTASEVENLLQIRTYNAAQLHMLIGAARACATSLKNGNNAGKRELLQTMVEHIDVRADKTSVCIDNLATVRKLSADSALQPAPENLVIERITVRLRRGKALKLMVAPKEGANALAMRDEKLIALVAEARATRGLIIANPDKSIPVLAAEHKRCRIRMAKVAKLGCLAPDIVAAIVEGRQPLKLTPAKLLGAELPLAWNEQKVMLGFD